MKSLTVIDPAEEQTITTYHATASYEAVEAEPYQPPMLSPSEVEREIHDALLLSVMVERRW